MAKAGLSVRNSIMDGVPVDSVPNFLHCGYRCWVIHSPRITAMGNPFDISWDETFVKQVIGVARFGKIGCRPLSTSLLHGWSDRFGGILDYNNVLCC
jgi:hypothetical protein